MFLANHAIYLILSTCRLVRYSMRVLYDHRKTIYMTCLDENQWIEQFVIVSPFLNN